MHPASKTLLNNQSLYSHELVFQFLMKGIHLQKLQPQTMTTNLKIVRTK